MIEIVNLRIFIFYMPFYSQSDHNKKKNNKNKLIVTIIIFMLQSTN